MKKLIAFLGAFMLLACAQNTVSEDCVVPDGAFLAVNPLTYTDIPDNDVIRVGEDYYMVSTTMFFCPGAPIMHSRDLVHWRIVSYIYDLLEDDDIYNLRDGKNAYGAGQWATSLRYHDGVYYALFVSNDQQKSYLYRTRDLVNGSWERTVFADYFFHDPGLLFDGDRLFVVYGNGDLKLAELSPDGSAVIGKPKVIVRAPKWRMGLRAEGCHFYKIGDYYYIVEIDWPKGGIRQATCWRSSKVDGPYKRKVVLKGTLDGRSGDGIAQGPIVDTPAGDWYAIQFQDHGAVGRIPTVQPVSWEDGWPVMGQAGKPMQMVGVKLPVDPAGDYVWASDEFSTERLALVWQWNHKDPGDASLTARPGWLQLQAHPGDSLSQTLGTLTQRTVGPRCVSEVLLDASGLGVGAEAGLCAFQSRSARIGVIREASGYFLIAREREKELWRQALPAPADAQASSASQSLPASRSLPAFADAQAASASQSLPASSSQASQSLPAFSAPASQSLPASSASQSLPAFSAQASQAASAPVWLRIRYVFTPREPGDVADTAFLSYSLDGENWTELDYTLSMKYTLDYFIGYRSALYCMGPSGSAAFDYFHQWVY